jgi:hypothetical protein
MFRDKCPFYTFIKSKPVKYGLKGWVAAVTKNLYSYNIQVYTGKTDGIREKKQDLRVDKGMVCHMYGTGRAVTADNFFTSRELAKLLLTRTVTLIGKLRKNESAIPALFLSGKQKQVDSSIFGFSNNLILVLRVPVRKKAVILLSSQHHDDTCMAEEKDRKPGIIMQNNVIKVFFFLFRTSV